MHQRDGNITRFKLDERDYEAAPMPAKCLGNESVMQYRKRTGQNRSRPITVMMTPEAETRAAACFEGDDATFVNRSDFTNAAVEWWIACIAHDADSQRIGIMRENSKLSKAAIATRRREERTGRSSVRIKVINYNRVRDLVIDAAQNHYLYPHSLTELISDAYALYPDELARLRAANTGLAQSDRDAIDDEFEEW